MSHPQLSIVIPAYNESARIEHALDRVLSCIAEQGWDAEVLVVDDGSKDDTAAIVQRWMVEHPRLHLVQNPGNKGKGYSVRNGLLQAAGDIVMFTDADLSAPMEEAQRLLDALADGADVAIGSRWMDRHAANHPSAALPSVLRTMLQLGHPHYHGPPVQRHSVRLQGLQTLCRADNLSSADHRALGLRPRNSLHSPQAEVRRSRGPRHLGPRRAQPHELPERRHEDARGHGAHPIELRARPLRRSHRRHEGHQHHGDSASGKGQSRRVSAPRPGNTHSPRTRCQSI